MKSKSIIAYLSILAVLFTYSCSEDYINNDLGAELGKNQLTIYKYLTSAENSSRFSKFNQMIEIAGLSNTLAAYNPASSGGYTLFAPTDEAVDLFIANSDRYNDFNDLLAQPEDIKDLVRYHIVMQGIRSENFTLGALSDTTATGDLLTMSYRDLYDQGLDSVQVLVNSSAVITKMDYEASNGYVHEISIMLTPASYTTFEWLKNTGGYGIFIEALEKTGLKDTINSTTRYDEYGNKIKNRFTLVVEGDSIYQKRGIMNYADLENKYSTEGSELTDRENGLYQFVAYHITETDYYLNDIEVEEKDENGDVNDPETYNTYSIWPYSIRATKKAIKIYQGIPAIDTINGEILNYIPLKIAESNNGTVNGAVHLLSEILELKSTQISTQVSYINQIDNEFKQVWQQYGAKRIFNVEEYTDKTKFTNINWKGVPILYYYNSKKDGSSWYEEIITMDGFFEVEFNSNKVYPGKYKVQVRMNSKYSDPATVQVFVDGIASGVALDDLKNKPTDGTWWENNNYIHNCGEVLFTDYTRHTITLKALVKGRMDYYYIRFVPVD